MNALIVFLSANFEALLQKTLEQIYLAGSALLLAILISLPLGMWIARKPRLRNYFLGSASILQTIPSLALLGFLLPFFGIGIQTAIIALTLYALLPILRNTVSGLLNVAPSVIEAADGLGFTKRQKMLFVELPLALPLIVAGIRTATAMSVGIATLAAFIGAGGLGDFIYQGLSLNNLSLILLGAIPAALLALLLDFFISRLERLLIKEPRHHRLNPKRIATVLLVTLMLLGLPVYFTVASIFLHKNADIIRVGSKNFSEQLILGEIIAQLMESKSKLKVIRRLNLGGTFVCHQAMLNNQIDIYPEYTGTALKVILQSTELPQELFSYVKTVYERKYHLTWLMPFGFNNSNALAIKRNFAIQKGIKNISELPRLASDLTIGVSPDFLQRRDGLLGLQDIYNLKFANIRLMDPGLMYKAIRDNHVNIIMAYSTDGRIPAYQLLLLHDDKHLFPSYEAAPVVRKALLAAHPEITNILQSLAHKLPADVMQRLNYDVDVLHKSPHDVAKAFLIQQKLI